MEMSISILVQSCSSWNKSKKKPWLAARNTAGCFIPILMDHKYPNINDNSGSLYFIEVWAALPKSLCKRSFIGQPSWTSVYKSIVRRETSSISLLHFLFIYLSFSYRLTWDTCPSRKASWEMGWFLLRKLVRSFPSGMTRNFKLE